VQPLKPANSAAVAASDQASLLRTLWDRQVDAWLQGKRTSAEELLAKHADLLVDDRCADLVLNEIDLREAVGETPQWEEYQRRFPQLERRLRGRFFGREDPSVKDAPPRDCGAAWRRNASHAAAA